MQNKANWAAVAAFVFGVAGFYIYTSRLADQLRGGTPRVALMLTQDLAPGQVLSETHLGKVSIPSHYLDSRRVLAAEQSKVLGLVVDVKLQAGDGLIWSDLRDGEAHKNLASLIAPGHRAFSLSARSNPLGSLLRVGDHVDVLLEKSGKSEVLLERVLVLTVGGNFGTLEPAEVKKEKKRDVGVTLSVSQEQATELLAADSKGTLTLVLRNSVDLKTRVSAQTPVPVRTIAASRLTAENRKEIEHVR